MIAVHSYVSLILRLFGRRIWLFCTHHAACIRQSRATANGVRRNAYHMLYVF